MYTPPAHKHLFHMTRRFIAKRWLSLMPALQIAVTGSQGKTNTTQTIYGILKQIGLTVVTDINLDTIYNVPITALRVRPSTKFAIFELGVDHPGEMDKHLEIVKPKIAVVTGISPVHTDADHLGSLENLIKEKRKLIEALPKNGYAILNYDDENVRKMAPFTKAKILWYGTDKKHCDIWANKLNVSLEGTAFSLNGQPVTTRLIGKHHIYTIMTAYLVYKLMVDNNQFPLVLTDFNQFLSNVIPLPGRMSVEPGPLGTTVLNDSLRANPSSTASGLQTLSEIEYKGGRKIAVLAEMGELADPVEEHKKIGRLIGRLKINFLIGIGPYQKYTVEEAVKSGMAKQNVFWVRDVNGSAEILKKIICADDLIYLKGSLHKGLWKITTIISSWKNI